MNAKNVPVRPSARSYAQSSTGRGRAPAQPPVIESEKSDGARRGILDATIGCFSEFGWSGTNMSVIARRSRMTRGRIQYYFPTLDGLLRAAVEHLMIEWRKKYFSSLSETAGVSARFDAGIAVLWGLMQDPLHIAKQELEATARTNAELRALLEKTSVDDDEASVQAAKDTYPELARYGDVALRRARNFTMVFMEGLANHRFSSEPETWRLELIEMLRGLLIAYWSALGMEDLKGMSRSEHNMLAAPALDEEKRTRALGLIQEAASLLSSPPARGGV